MVCRSLNHRIESRPRGVYWASKKLEKVAEAPSQNRETTGPCRCFVCAH